jgi:hypothetical protein
MKAIKAIEKLIELDACKDACDWVEDRTIEQAWNECERGGWMLWFYNQSFPEKTKELAIAKAHYANTVRHLMLDERSTRAVDSAIEYGMGKITREELYFISGDAFSAASMPAFNPITCYIYAAYAAAYAAAFTNPFANFPANYASAAAENYKPNHESYIRNQKQCADICRKYLNIQETTK